MEDSIFTDELLKKVCKRSNEIYINKATQNYDGSIHEFSESFKRKINRLNRISQHPVFYASLKRVACILLAVLIGSGAWLTVDVDARTAVTQWVKQRIQNYYVIKGTISTEVDKTEHDYELGWIPDGYREYEKQRIGVNTIKTLFIDDEDHFLTFIYSKNSDEINWAFDMSSVEEKSISINGIQGSYFVSFDPDVSDGIVWINDNHAFFISGFVSEMDLISLAESIVEKNYEN